MLFNDSSFLFDYLRKELEQIETKANVPCHSTVTLIEIIVESNVCFPSVILHHRFHINGP